MFLGRLKFAVVMFVMTGFSVAFGQEAPWNDGLQNIIDMMTGTTATLTATVAVIFLGYLALAGKLEMKFAGSIIGGIVLIFGAPHVVSWFS